MGASMRTVRPITGLDSRYIQSRDAMSVPEADTSGEEDGLIGRELLDCILHVNLCKVGRWHREGSGKAGGLDEKGEKCAEREMSATRWMEGMAGRDLKGERMAASRGEEEQMHRRVADDSPDAGIRSATCQPRPRFPRFCSHPVLCSRHLSCNPAVGLFVLSQVHIQITQSSPPCGLALTLLPVCV